VSDPTAAGAELPDRLRFRYSKLGKIRFTSQRDVARMWERALRRSGLPVAWSGGFSPRPQLSFGLALPTGAESLGEYLDVRLDEAEPQVGGSEAGPVDTTALPGTMSALLPEGIDVQAARFVPHATESLQEAVASCVWELEVLGVAGSELAARVEQVLGAPHVVIRRVRKGRPVEDDLRPAIRAMTPMMGSGDGSGGGGTTCRLRAELATHPRGVRPGELLQGLGADLVLVRACRTHQWIERDGARWEPLGSGGTDAGHVAVHAQERAS
jgi:radical SAM-linked protein